MELGAGDFRCFGVRVAEVVTWLGGRAGPSLDDSRIISELWHAMCVSGEFEKCDGVSYGHGRYDVVFSMEL